MQKRKMDWNRGSGIFVMMPFLLVFFLVGMLLYMCFLNIMYANTIAMTRSDAIADSVATYSQSYDYKFNHGQAIEMTTELVRLNNLQESQKPDNQRLYTLANFQTRTLGKTGTAQGVQDTLLLDGEVQMRTFYPSFMGGTEAFCVKSHTEVSSVDIYGDVFVVPDDIGYNRDNEVIENGSGADAVVP